MARDGGAEDGDVGPDLHDVLHDRAVVWLRGHLRAVRHRAAAGDSDVHGPVGEAATEGRLLALEHVGAITPAEGAAWRERLREAAAWEEPLYPPPSPEVLERASAHLERLAAPVVPTAREASTACLSAISAYAKTGVLTAAEALAWRERLRAQMGMEPERPPRCSQRTLLRVIPGSPERRQGLRITSAELYEDGVVLRWHSARAWPDGSETPRIWNDVDIETAGAHDLVPRSLMDDLGTRYAGGGDPAFGINGGGWVVRLGASSFTPAVPAPARRLLVPLRDGGLDIDLVTP